MEKFNKPRYLSRKDFYNKDYEGLIYVFNNIPESKYEEAIKSLIKNRNSYLLEKIINSITLSEENYKNIFMCSVKNNINFKSNCLLLDKIKHFNISEFINIVDYYFDIKIELIKKILKENKVDLSIKNKKDEEDLLILLGVILEFEPKIDFFELLFYNNDLKDFVKKNIDKIREPKSSLMKYLNLEDLKNKINNF